MRAILALLLLSAWAFCKPFPAQLNPNHPLYSNVVGLWAFCEPVPTAADAVIASPLSTAFNGVAGVLPARVADATYGPVASFTGTEYFNCGAFANYERTQAFSSTWIIKAINTQAGYIYSKQNGSLRGHSLQYSNGIVVLRITNQNGNLIQVSTPAATITLNQWHTVTATYDGGSLAAGCRIYVDGVSKALTVTTDALSSTIITTEAFAMGARTPTTAAVFFIGQNAFGAFFNKELSAAEQLSIYSRPFALLNRGYAGGMRMRYLINNGIFNGR
jgi:hypothetical protein